MTTDRPPLSGEALLIVHEYAEMLRLLNAGCREDGSYERCPELQAKFDREDAELDRWWRDAHAKRRP